MKNQAQLLLHTCHLSIFFWNQFITWAAPCSQPEPRPSPLHQLSNPRPNNGDLPGQQVTLKAPVLPPGCMVVQIATRAAFRAFTVFTICQQVKQPAWTNLFQVSMSCKISDNKDTILRKYFKVLTFDSGIISYQYGSFWVSGDKVPTCNVEDLGYASSCAWFKANRERKGLWRSWETKRALDTLTNCQLRCSLFPKQSPSPPPPPQVSGYSTVYTMCTLSCSWFVTWSSKQHLDTALPHDRFSSSLFPFHCVFYPRPKFSCWKYHPK